MPGFIGVCLLIAGIVNTSTAKCPELVAVTPEVEKHAFDIAKSFESDDSLENKLARIIAHIHSDNGIALKQMHGLQRLRSYYGLAKHILPDPRGIFFAPSAGDIVKYRMAFGCSHYARAFVSIVKALNLVNDDDIRYVVSSSYKDYQAACPKTGAAYNGDMTINGHQFAAVRYNGHWWFINTSNKDFEKVRMDSMDYLGGNISVKFPSYATNTDTGHNELLVRYISKNSKDGACDDSFLHLMNISVSGDSDGHICHW